MIMDEDQRGGPQFQRALEHLARVDRRVIDGPALLSLMRDQHVLAVEKKDMKLLPPIPPRTVSFHYIQEFRHFPASVGTVQSAKFRLILRSWVGNRVGT